jgi:AraC-like DNA-binding protein
MNAQAEAGSSLHFSTRDLAGGKRLAALRELFDRSIQMEIDAEPGCAVEMQMHIAPGLRRARMLSALTARVVRPAQRLADGEDTVCLMIKTGGHLSLTQGRREGVPDAGDAVLLIYREPAVLQFVEAAYQSVRVPFSALAPLADVEAAAARRVRRDSEALALLRSYVAGLPDRIADGQLARLAAAHVYDLLALAIGATGDAREQAIRGGVRAARLAAVRADLVAEPTRTLDALAARHGITPRYVQMLFEREGTTFTEFGLEQRLAAAWRMLVSPRYAAWSIAAIAMEAGFGDLSHFNRRFRRRYQITPTDARRRQGRGAPEGSPVGP